MSHVLNAIITTLPGEEAEALKVLTEALKTEGHKAVPLFQDISRQSCGAKAFEMSVYLIAFNHLAPATLINLVALAPWRYPEGVSLFLCDEHDSHFYQAMLPWDRVTVTITRGS